MRLPTMIVSFKSSLEGLIVVWLVWNQCSSLTRSRSACSRNPLGFILSGANPRSLPGQQHPHTCARAVVRAGRGETPPLWQGQQEPCLGHWACAGRQASAGRFSDRPAGTGSQYQSWHLWTASQWGPWAGWGETLRSLSRSKKSKLKNDYS